jgi:hypothetical protein
MFLITFLLKSFLASLNTSTSTFEHLPISYFYNQFVCLFIFNIFICPFFIQFPRSILRYYLRLYWSVYLANTFVCFLLLLLNMTDRCSNDFQERIMFSWSMYIGLLMVYLSSKKSSNKDSLLLL